MPFSRIQKRDGRLVPFDKTKITDAIFKAALAVGGSNRAMSEELAEVVSSLLETNFSDSEIPHIEDIQDLVEKVLMETGHVKTAKAYILYRESRRRIREALRVRDSHASLRARGRPLLVEAGDHSGYAAWDRGLIVKALVREADLPEDVANQIAVTVEKRILASGMELLSTALIRELVDNDLFDRGLQVSLKRQVRLGMPKYDLEEILGHRGKGLSDSAACPCATKLDAAVAGHTLKQYALECIHPGPAAAAHNEGGIRMLHLDMPTRLHTTVYRPDAATLSTVEIVGNLVELAHFTSYEMILDVPPDAAFAVLRALTGGGSRWSALLPKLRIRSVLKREYQQGMWQSILSYLDTVQLPAWLALECRTENVCNIPLEQFARAGIGVCAGPPDSGILLGVQLNIGPGDHVGEAFLTHVDLLKEIYEQRRRFMWNIAQGQGALLARLWQFPGMVTANADELLHLPLGIYIHLQEPCPLSGSALLDAIKDFLHAMDLPVLVFPHPPGKNAFQNGGLGRFLHKGNGLFADYLRMEGKMQSMQRIRSNAPIVLEKTDGRGRPYAHLLRSIADAGILLFTPYIQGPCCRACGREMHAGACEACGLTTTVTQISCN